MRLISSAAAAGASPNFDPSWPVRTLACVSAVTPGMMRTSTSCWRPSVTVASSRSTSSLLSITIRPIPLSTASLISASLLAFPCRTRSAGSAPARSAVMISPPPATSRPMPSSVITRCTAVHGNAFEAKITREFSHRAASSPRYSRARARSAISDTTRTGVSNSAATSAARQPPTTSPPSSSTALPGGNSDSRSATGCPPRQPARQRVGPRPPRRRPSPLPWR